MAVSKLWPVTVRLATVLDYAANPEKTTKAKSKYSNADYQALRDVVNYVKDGKKTEQELFCQGINCNPSRMGGLYGLYLYYCYRLGYDAAAISEPVAPVTVERNKRAVSDRTKYAKGVGGAKPQALFLPRSHSDMPTKRNKRDVWSVSTNSHRGYGHFAMYPERLIEPCILAGSPEQGLVLDPFFGSGTTGAVCKRLSRRYLGIELNPEYCETAKTRIQQTKEELYLGSKNQP